jgi:hypothetical protein
MPHDAHTPSTESAGETPRARMRAPRCPPMVAPMPISNGRRWTMIDIGDGALDQTEAVPVVAKETTHSGQENRSCGHQAHGLFGGPRLRDQIVFRSFGQSWNEEFHKPSCRESVRKVPISHQTMRGVEPHRQETQNGRWRFRRHMGIGRISPAVAPRSLQLAGGLRTKPGARGPDCSGQGSQHLQARTATCSPDIRSTKTRTMHGSQLEGA